ncbi:hypothetical protein BDZ97DRAFT_1799081 [Flammula alnicola]|nr:hypothetical protein BDZ97DRAFT_1799081 [Flammula alnicola]
MAIPLELRTAIFDELADKKDLLACRAVSKEFESLMTHRVFQVLNLSRENGSHAAFTALVKAPHLMQHIKAINFRAESNEIDKNEGGKCLEIRGLLTYPNENMQLDGFRAFLRPITTLVIALTSLDQGDNGYCDEDYTSFLEEYLPNFLSSSVDLESLTLLSDVETNGPNFPQWDAITLPRLTSLRLASFVFVNWPFYGLGSDTGLEYFIVRHAQSLRHLDLSGCCVAIENEDANPRSWANIWTRFEGQLVNLTTFVFDPLPGLRSEEQQDDDDPGYVGYVTLLIESGYINFFDEPPQDFEVDRLAFESFQNVIAARKS